MGKDEILRFNSNIFFYCRKSVLTEVKCGKNLNTCCKEMKRLKFLQHIYYLWTQRIKKFSVGGEKIYLTITNFLKTWWFSLKKGNAKSSLCQRIKPRQSTEKVEVKPLEFLIMSLYWAAVWHSGRSTLLATVPGSLLGPCQTGCDGKEKNAALARIENPSRNCLSVTSQSQPF